MKYIIAFTFSFALFNCTTVDDTLSFDETPHIELLEMYPDTVKEFIDSLRFRVYYEDGNGDLGYNNNDSNSIFIHDFRFTRSDSFYLGPIGPEGINNSIKGEITFILPNIYKISNNPSEKTSFEISIRDRAGNLSNVIVTEQVVIID